MIQVAENIQLKRATPDDAKDIFRTIDKNRELLRIWLPFVDHTQKEADTLEFLESAGQGGEMVFTIRTEGAFAGLIGLKSIDDANKKAEIGYWLDPAFEGKGLVTRSCLKLIEYAFEELGLNRILIQVATGNRKSRMVPARLGFLEEGIEREGELLISGYTDVVRYSLLKREYDDSL